MPSPSHKFLSKETPAVCIYQYLPGFGWVLSWEEVNCSRYDLLFVTENNQSKFQWSDLSVNPGLILPGRCFFSKGAPKNDKLLLK